MKPIRFLFSVLFLYLMLSSVGAWAQFSGTVSGTVVDPSGAVVPMAAVKLTNDATGQISKAKTNSSGVFTFPSLAPGNYQLACTAAGFAGTIVPVVLETNQVLNVPVRLAVSGTVQTVQVTTQSPLLDTADNRIQETISTDTLSTLPLAGENMISLVTLAPGVTGTGVTSNGSPGSGRDNYSTETQVDSSANGQGSVGNMFIVDGLDVTSSIRPGVLNLTPNPDSIQEASIQTNTYSVLYGRASSVEMTMTTKSGTSHYHGNVEDFFTNQSMLATTEFNHTYAPFHSNNISASVGGPIWPGKKLGFFFFEIEPQLASNAVTNSTSFADPAFVQYAQANYPNTVGTKILNSYPVSGVSNIAVSSTAADLFPSGSSTACGTPATGNLPCNLPMIDTANFNSSAYRNGDQYFIRGDEAFRKDRLYGTVFRTTLSFDIPNVYPAFNDTNKNYQWAVQGNETHTFSPNTLNEAYFGADRIEGINPITGLFDVPIVNVTGVGAGYGDGFAQGDFIQHNYHWRDVLTHLVGNHDIQAGFEGMFGDDIRNFAGAYDQPTFQFNNLLDLAQDHVFTETGLAYSPLTGQRDQYNWNAAEATYGLFAGDTWKASRRITLTYGVRWDDFGNPYSRSSNTALSDFYFGPGQTQQQQIANGILVRHDHALQRSITDIFSPRAGIAWDLQGNGNWLVKGGAGIFHNWPTLANLVEEYSGNPPGDIFPTFYGGQTPAPIFGYGTSNQQPFGFPAPALPAESLNAAGGLPGLQFTIGGVNPTLASPVAYIYSAGLAHRMSEHFVASVDYSGANGRKLLSGGGQVFSTFYGQDINELPGDLIAHSSLVPQRLNTNFGEILYTANDRVSNYNALILALQGRFGRSFFNASYTRSSSSDDTQLYPSYINVHQWYGPSTWNAPNRFSLAWNYNLPDVYGDRGVVGHIGSGWIISGTAAIQSGYPFAVSTNAAFAPVCSNEPGGGCFGAGGALIPGAVFSGNTGGDYNADGDDFDFPNVSSYSQGNSRHAFLQGVFAPGQFPQPAFGQEGNERYDRFTGPNFDEWDASLLKNTKIHENLQFQFRFDFFNVFNRANLTSMDTNLPDATFGHATSQLTPRFLQIGGNLTF